MSVLRKMWARVTHRHKWVSRGKYGHYMSIGGPRTIVRFECDECNTYKIVRKLGIY